MLILSPREKKLLRRLAQGKTDGQIAVEIGGREDQIALQRQRLMDSLQIRSQHQLRTIAEEQAAWPDLRGRSKF
ncbi:LuxR C-terminal-related transcriptional regulator [Bradyrhizobium ivorense]|uniref:LuxR C-terminal-related transcriptional regulator n=1 Tax=Bradyrhizobium ivorense TaxID=2511166 RepID=UPI001121BA5B|nr:LuxR C-terminal-related transcriptional regulator [Bradyrhizobium ivorense]